MRCLRPFILSLLLAAPSSGANLTSSSDPLPTIGDTLVLSGPVRHRSLAEEALALPGTLLYLPFHLIFVAGETAAGAVWEERIIDRTRAWLTTADGRAGIRPLASTQIGTGARLFYRDLLFDGDASLTSSRGREKRQHHLFTLSFPGSPHHPGPLALSLQFRQEPKETFFGSGHNTLRSASSAYLQEVFSSKIIHRRRISRALTLNALLGYQTVDIGTSISQLTPTIQSRYLPDQLPGLDDRLHHLEAALLLRALFVDRPGSPLHGNRSLVRLEYKRSIDDDDFSHFQFLIRTEQFFELFYRRTLSLHLGADWRFAPGRDRIPFYDLASLGGNELLRGYRRGRFRDLGTVLAAATYKYPVWKFLDGELFYETGRTFHQPNDFTLNGWKFSWGAGLRLWVPRGLIFEQLIAISAEETRLLFNFKADL
jgi:hypothetical protein